MDQKKIGRFIAELRKEKGMTQKNLAEKLFMTDKAVSKWECGYSMPDNSVMLKLCEIFEISVNELLSGERLSSVDYNKKAEENIMTLIQENNDSKKKGRRQFVISTAAVILLALYFYWFINRITANSLRILDFIDFIALNVDFVLPVIMLLLAGRFGDFLNVFKFNVKKCDNPKDLENAKKAATFAIWAVILAGGICFDIYLVSWLGCLENAGYWGKNFNKIVTGPFLSWVVSAILLVLRERLKED